MDKVQIYAVILLAFTTTITAVKAGKAIERDSGIDFAKAALELILSVAMSLPLYGRIFGWW